VETGRRPEGEKAERGDDRRQREGRDAEQLEDVRPGGVPAPEEPGERQRDGERQHGRKRGKRKRGKERIAPFGIGEDLSVPAERKALRREGERLLLVHRHAGDDDERQREE